MIDRFGVDWSAPGSRDYPDRRSWEGVWARRDRRAAVIVVTAVSASDRRAAMIVMTAVVACFGRSFCCYRAGRQHRQHGPGRSHGGRADSSATIRNSRRRTHARTHAHTHSVTTGTPPTHSGACKKTWGFPSQFIRSTKVFMATPQGRRLGYHTPEQVSNQGPPDSRPGVLTTTLHLDTHARTHARTPYTTLARARVQTLVLQSCHAKTKQQL